MELQNFVVMSVLGARPQFVKLGPVSRALRARGLREVVVHTGQHYDFALSGSFFEELGLPSPDINLGIATPGPLNQLGHMAPALGRVIREQKPDMVLVFGDTTSTIAATLAASYAGVPVGHVEAGMRSFRSDMPEEIARVVTDRLASLLFTASEAADENLRSEGLGPTIRVGDTMLDVVRAVLPRLDAEAPAQLARYGVSAGEYALATVHRARNTDDPERLRAILEGLSSLGVPVIFPIHPRTRAAISHHGLSSALDGDRVQVVEPLPYFETMVLARHARRVFTDSGGLQKEALFVGRPCSTLRDETEWVETVESGWNVLTGADRRAILDSLSHTPPTATPPALYGEGRAGEAIGLAIAEWFGAG